MIESILNSTKKTLGIDPDYTAFDEDILLHINSVFSTLYQLGIGPVEGFAIEDDTAVWADFLVDNRLNNVRTYMALRVRMLFDPPQTSFAITAMEEQIKEQEWRMNVEYERTGWTDPDPDPIPDDSILDGGLL